MAKAPKSHHDAGRLQRKIDPLTIVIEGGTICQSTCPDSKDTVHSLESLPER
jgi:hypothetical protein